MDNENAIEITVQNDYTALVRDAIGNEQDSPLRFDELRLTTIGALNEWLMQGSITNNGLRALGEHLYEGLFCEYLKDSFEKELKKARESNEKELKKARESNKTQKNKQALFIHLKFEKDADKLSHLPWEYLYFPGGQGYASCWLAADNHLVLTRRISSIEIDDSQNFSPRRLRILIARSEPEDLGRVDVELEPVIQAIEEKSDSHEWELTELNNPTLREFQDSLKKGSPEVVHFIGHCRSNGKESSLIAFRNEGEDKSGWYREEQFTHSFDIMRRHVQLIFLHLYDEEKDGNKNGLMIGSMARSLLMINPQAVVVAVQQPMAADQVEKFVARFYEELASAERKRMSEAVQIGRYRLYWHLPDTNDFGKLVLYVRRDSVLVPPKKPSALRRQATYHNEVVVSR